MECLDHRLHLLLVQSFQLLPLIQGKHLAEVHVHGRELPLQFVARGQYLINLGTYLIVVRLLGSQQIFQSLICLLLFRKVAVEIKAVLGKDLI
jgi:hypothetical protein